MAEKLKSALRNPRLVLLLKSAALALLLYWLPRNFSGAFFALIFVLAAALFYARPLFHSAEYFRSWIVLVGFGVLASGSLPPLYQVPAVAAYGALFYILLGLKEYVLVNRLWWHAGLFYVLYYGTLLAAVAAALPDYFFTPVLWATFASFILFSELLRVNTFASARQSFATAALFAMLTFQGFWVASILPLGAIGIATIVAAGGFCFAEIALDFYSKKSNWRRAVARCAIFLALCILILLSAKWRL